ncbi:MAG: hypothetical protein LUQ37_06675 [Methanoregulaceae archaeon]|nr:hypothetical protein [Methanoregulaceae archaeon]
MAAPNSLNSKGRARIMCHLNPACVPEQGDGRKEPNAFFRTSGHGGSNGSEIGP